MRDHLQPQKYQTPPHLRYRLFWPPLRSIGSGYRVRRPKCRLPNTVQSATVPFGLRLHTGYQVWVVKIPIWLAADRLN